MITPEEADKALHYLIDSSSKAAAARANRLHLEDFSRVLKARLMCECQDLPVNAQERQAYASGEYERHLLGLKAAIEEDEKLRFLREAADARLRAFQTQSA